MNKLVFFLIIFVFSSAAIAETYGNITVDKIVSVYDGDTFRCNIKDWPKIAGKNIAVRVKNIDTPEIRCKKSYSDDDCKRLKTLARTARRLTENLLKRAKVIELRNIERGKYFRLLADVYVDDKNLAEILIKNKLAVLYDGGRKSDWLKDKDKYESK